MRNKEIARNRFFIPREKSERVHRSFCARPFLRKWAPLCDSKWLPSRWMYRERHRVCQFKLIQIAPRKVTKWLDANRILYHYHIILISRRRSWIKDNIILILAVTRATISHPAHSFLNASSERHVIPRRLAATRHAWIALRGWNRLRSVKTLRDTSVNKIASRLYAGHLSDSPISPLRRIEESVHPEFRWLIRVADNASAKRTTFLGICKMTLPKHDLSESAAAETRKRSTNPRIRDKEFAESRDDRRSRETLRNRKIRYPSSWFEILAVNFLGGMTMQEVVGEREEREKGWRRRRAPYDVWDSKSNFRSFVNFVCPGRERERQT